MSQLSCSSDDVAQQEKCFQYFTGLTGTVSRYEPLSSAAPTPAQCVTEPEVLTEDQGRDQKYDGTETRMMATTINMTEPNMVRYRVQTRTGTGYWTRTMTKNGTRTSKKNKRMKILLAIFFLIFFVATIR